MALENLIAVECKLSKGLFSSERTFEVVLANQKRHSGPVPRHFCWNAEKTPLHGVEAEKEEIDGFVAARIVDTLENDQIAIEVPDGEVLAVRRNQVQKRPTQIQPSAATSV